MGGKYLQREFLDASFLSRNKGTWPPLSLGQTLLENGDKEILKGDIFTSLQRVPN